MLNYSPKNYFTASLAPSTGDDLDSGYDRGSRWIQYAGSIYSIYTCVDPARSAANWQMNAGSSSTPSGPAGGDLTGTYPNPTVDVAKITYAKIQNVSATDKILGRSSAGAGVVQEITCTAAGRAILDDADAATQRATIGANPYDIAWFVAGKPTASQVCLEFLAVRDVVLPASLTGSQAKAGTASGASAAFDIQVNTVSKGTITFATSATGSFTFASPVTLTAGDVLTVVAPGSQDANLADVRVTFAGTY